MNHFSRISILLACILVLAVVAARADEPAVVADRSPLTFHDSGLYCNYNIVHGRQPAEDGVTNLLDADRAASADSPWTFYIMQYTAPEEARPDYVATNIREMARAGKKVILRAGIGGGVSHGSSLDVDAAEQRMINLFQEVDPAWLYAVTLDEENVYWNGNAAALTELYYRVKARWPDLPVYQWWTPMIAPNVHAESGWVALPADGWVCDLYGVPREEFEKKICMFLETGTPLVHIAWASPTWMFYDREGVEAEQWWPERGRAIFDQQLDVCRGYNIPVAYFVCQSGGTDDDGNSYPIRWGWHAVDPITRQWFAELEAMVSNFPYLADETMGYRSLNEAKLAWAHSWGQPVEVTFSLDEQGAKRVSWHWAFSDVSVAAGEHVLSEPFGNPYFSVNYSIDDDTAEFLRGGFAIGGRAGYNLNVDIVFEIVPEMPIMSPRVTAQLAVTQELGGFASVAWSSDGENWSEPIAAESGQRKQELAVEPESSGFSDDPFYVQVTLSAGSGSVTNVCARIQALQVEATFEAPLEVLAQ